jgi:hypothetical protein
MTSSHFAIAGLLLMLLAVGMAALGVSTSIAAVPLAVSVVLAICAARDEIVHRSSRR